MQPATLRALSPESRPSSKHFLITVSPKLVSNLKDNGKAAANDLIDQGKELAKEKLGEEAKKLIAELSDIIPFENLLDELQEQGVVS